MSKLTAEVQQLVGTQFLFQRDPVAGVGQGLYDLGLFEPAGIKGAKKPVVIYDSSSGRKRPIKTIDSSAEWTVDLKTSNLNLRNLALLLNAGLPSAYAQTSTQVTADQGVAYPDSLLKIVDAGGNPVYNLASVQFVETVGGGSTYTQGTDWSATADDLLRGVIRILAGGTITTPTPVTVEYTPVAFTGNRLIVPNSGPCQLEGQGYFFAAGCDNGSLAVWDGRFQLSVSSANFSVDKESDIDVKLMKLYDPANVNPLGRYLQINGSLATGS